LNNKEFTFSVDVSKLPCGLNGALYFVEMDSDGGKSKYSGAQPGAEYGLGYCDAKCPNDLRIVNGEPNGFWKDEGSDSDVLIRPLRSC
jgi:cellulose 1,4-beta-cellobiosidase